MNKKIRLYIFLLLFSLSEQKIQTSPFSAKLYNNNLQFFTQLSFTDIQKIIYDYPKLSIFIAVFISLISCKKLFFSNNKNKLNTTIPSKAEIHYSAEKATATLILTPHDKEASYCYNNLYSWEASPSANYILAHQLNETSIGSTFSQALFGGLGASAIIQNLLGCSSLYHIIDIKTGTILSLENAQQCTFSSNEKYLIIREVKPIGKLSKFLSLFKKVKSLQAHKDISCIQYRIIDLITKKTVAIFNDIFSATFYNDDHLTIIDSFGNKKYFKPNTISSFNPFANKIQYIEYEELTSPSLIPIKFYFDNSRQTYCLDIEMSPKSTQTIEHVKTYYQYNIYNNNYLLINTDQNYKTIQLLPSNTTTWAPWALIESIQSIITKLKKPTFLTQLKNLSTGITLFTYTNPIMYTLTQNNTIFIAEITRENTINYKTFDFTNSSIGSYDNGKVITFLNSNKYTVKDENDLSCKLTNPTSVIFESTIEIATQTKNILKDAFTITAQDLQENGQTFFNQLSNNLKNLVTSDQKKTIIPDIINIQNDHTITYNMYAFNYKKSQTTADVKTNYQQLLKDNIHAFEWNIHIFNLRNFKTFFNSLEGQILPNNKICISHLPPQEMHYSISIYQSLKSELEKVINYMKENTKAIISIVLLTNDCSLKQIDDEITEILNNKKYNPLLSPLDLKEQKKELATLKIEEMIQTNKRLLFFANKENMQTTHPIRTISKCIKYID